MGQFLSYREGEWKSHPLRGGRRVLERKRARAGIQTVIKNSGSMLPLPVGGGKVQENLGEARLMFMSGQTLGNFELSTQYGLRMMSKGKSLELVEVNVWAEMRFHRLATEHGVPATHNFPALPAD